MTPNERLTKDNQRSQTLLIEADLKINAYVELFKAASMGAIPELQEQYRSQLHVHLDEKLDLLCQLQTNWRQILLNGAQ